MADPQTVNVGLSVPLRGTDVGTWDVPVNGDFNALDGLFGGVQTISASSVPITLTSPAGFTATPGGGPVQSQNAVLRFTGALTAGVPVALPVPGYYIIENLTTGAFVLQFWAKTVGSGQAICVDQGETQHIYNDGTNVKFVNLGRVGSYLDICDATVPSWISNCTIPPYLDCNGSTFNATTYPYLNVKLGGNTLPDFRGRGAFYLNEGTGNLTSGGAGIDGNTRFATGGHNGLTANLLPTITSNGANAISVTSTPNVTNGPTINAQPFASGSPVPVGNGQGQIPSTNPSQAIAVSSNNTSGNSVGPNAAPGIVSGLRLIRAA